MSRRRAVIVIAVLLVPGVVTRIVKGNEIILERSVAEVQRCQRIDASPTARSTRA